MNNAEIEALLTNKGVKPTSNRILVIKELLKASRPVSLADLEAAMDFSMNKATIFRVLDTFSESDIIHVIEDGSRSLKYELCHGSGHHSISDQHVHFFCERCHKTFCFESAPVPAVDIPEGFHPHSVNYMIKGLCPHCSSCP